MRRWRSRAAPLELRFTKLRWSNFNLGPALDPWTGCAEVPHLESLWTQLQYPSALPRAYPARTVPPAPLRPAL